MATSGTFNFQSIEIELIIREAYENIGILGEFVESQKLDSAKRSIDLLLLEWMNKSVNLWTLQSGFLSLVTNQTRYVLPISVSDVLQANLRTSVRQLQGTAATSAGSTGAAQNAFDGNPLTSCVTAANGNISYDYGAGGSQQINFFGIQINNNVSTLYNSVVEASNDGVTWTALLTISQTLSPGKIEWFDVDAPIPAQIYRMRATGGTTINAQEIYFNNNVVDMPIGCISRDEYYSLPVRQLIARPNAYYFQRSINPVFNIYPAPDFQYNCIEYSYIKMMEDTGQLYTNNVQVPARFYPALIWGLSARLAIKFNPQIAPMLTEKYEQAFAIAANEDAESTPIQFTMDYEADDYL